MRLETVAAALVLTLLAASPAPGPARRGVAREKAKTSPDAGCPVVFTDVAAKAGLKFMHERGATAAHQLPETMGSGVAWLDYDNDGWMDLYVVQSGPFPPNGSPRAQDRLYHNNGDGTFTDVTEKAGLKDSAYGMGVVAADYDNDGYVDLFVTNFGRNILYHNNGNGTFTDVTEKAGVAGSGWSTSAAFADFDGDGLLDLFVTRYLDYSVEKNYFCGDLNAGKRDYCHPSLYPPIGNLLYRNNGDGTFTDVSESSGIASSLGKGLGVVVSDFDDDGRPDIYVADDTTMNLVFHNLGGMKFEDVSLLSGAGVSVAGQAFGGMGVDAGDLDGDGRIDVVVANFEAEPNSFFRNLGSMVFEDASAVSGFGPPHFYFSGFGLNLFDAANAGRLDAFIANGHVLEVPRMQGVTYAERPFLMWNDGKGHFRERGCGEPFRRQLVGRGSAVADYDNDGALDIAVSNSGGPLELLRNDGKHGGWIGFLLRGKKSNRQGIGARVTLETDAGRQVREVKAGGSYLSSSDPRVHFGIGTSSVRRVLIRWPSGILQEVRDIHPGQYQTIEEAAGERPPG
ncbi:MAG TPA: CRTAC1 family protein [Thermoanaerobaculia bacterium]|nr:CRTAC1 family protein [Thermoanaerobaculia bacterium]